MLSLAEFWRQPLFLSPPCRIPGHVQHGQGFAALPSLPMSDCPSSPVLPLVLRRGSQVGVSPAAPKQAELDSTAGLAPLWVIDPGLPQLCRGRSPSYFRQSEFAMPGAAQEPPAAFLG